jgi:6-phosphogluconolactonase/glucosamine-6-phosphate isomerase/deaminase
MTNLVIYESYHTTRKGDMKYKEFEVEDYNLSDEIRDVIVIGVGTDGYFAYPRASCC